MTGRLAVEETRVLTEVIAVIAAACPRVDPEIDEIIMSTNLREDLAIASVELINVVGRLKMRYDDDVDFLDLVVGFQQCDIEALTVGSLVEYIVSKLAQEKH
ncbi:hypothetical protein [Actinoalloteichus hymeniacidonis]|uniref:Carrier domain-containing protein n=1 Tax=Actinoalloteichus hymeniacidonis TaxID=340345 RepID=A0AAC9HSC8_9PSEU|nr:hypothetical protein [Actinoalloteichus hymeniacidonis]AOS64464.1 hypothetical protein TL08_18345 [Actinoalloteichus hymeniacidonis]MBB5907466.1 acyl carrier protein [Actinoalloteichus hymeniacidonis]